MGFLKLFSHGLIKFCVRLILHSTGYLLFPFYWKPFWNVNVVFILSNWNDIDHFQTHSIVPESYCAIFSYLCWCTAQVPCDYIQIFLIRKGGLIRWNFSFDSFLSTLNTCIQLPNVNEIFQSTIMKVFQKKKFLPDFW